ncbi:MAG: hypothetical protein F4X98_08945 [Gammaproteobacteria bacterium]|nr:hypothetical protein [Gammaproteobacteria bacterium]
MHGQDRYACSTHVMSGGYTNARSVRRTVLEECVGVTVRPTPKLLRPASYRRPSRQRVHA